VKQPLRLLRATQLPWAVDWDEIFGKTSQPDAYRPLILEIGFGYGQYLRHLSKLYPAGRIVGVEISNVCLMKAERAIARGELPNVRVIYAKAETALHHLFTPDSIDEIHVNFPDPWFKNRHGHRRLIQPDTVEAMVSRMKPGARLYLATDILEYAEMSAEVLAGTAGLSNLLDAPWVKSLPGRTTTKYEARAIEAGRSCYYFVYQRNQQNARDLPVIKDYPMPHIVFQTPLTQDEIQARFQSEEYNDHESGININYMNLYKSDKALLFEVFVDEPTIEQRVGLVLIRRDDVETADGVYEYTLRLGTIGSPRPTRGMHLAVSHLADWMLALHPNSRVIQRKLQIE
jgi:tRNA (guanine-N7-)-methyltransferase